MADDDDWLTSLVRTLAVDPSLKLAKDFLFNAPQFAATVSDMDRREMIREITSQAKFELQLFTSRAILQLNPVMFGFEDSERRVFGQLRGYFNLVPDDHDDDGRPLRVWTSGLNADLGNMLKTQAEVPTVQATTFRRRDQKMIWKGQLSGACVLDEGTDLAFKTYDLFFRRRSTLIDNRER